MNLESPLGRARSALPLVADSPALRLDAAEGDGAADALLRALDAARAVQRKPQLFLWMQTHLRRFVPHELAVCAAVRPGQGGLASHVFHGVPLPPEALASLSDPASALMRGLLMRLNAGARRPEAVLLNELQLPRDAATLQLLRHDFAELLVHGVPSAREPHALDTLFVFGSRQRRTTATERHALDLLIAPLHLMVLRVSGSDDGLGDLPGDARAAGRGSERSPQRAAGGQALTARERQILALVRDGQRNSDVGEALGISALTVKNHLQKILRKLGASNRAQAVAEALSQNLLARSPAAHTPAQTPARRPRRGP